MSWNEWSFIIITFNTNWLISKLTFGMAAQGSTGFYTSRRQTLELPIIQCWQLCCYMIVCITSILQSKKTDLSAIKSVCVHSYVACRFTCTQSGIAYRVHLLWKQEKQQPSLAFWLTSPISSARMSSVWDNILVKSKAAVLILYSKDRPWENNLSGTHG